jgi:hypothetical protein
MELRASRTFSSFSRDPSPIILSDRALLKTAYVPARDASLAMDWRFNRTRDPIDFDEEDELLTRDRTSRLRGEAVAEFWRGELAARSRDWWFQDADRYEGRSRHLAARVFPARTRTTLGMVGYRRRELDHELRSFGTDIGTLGVRRWHNRRDVSELEIGVARTRFTDDGASEHDLAVAVGMARAAEPNVENWGGRVRIGHDVTTSALIEVESVWPNKRLAARWESMLDSEGGVFQEPTRTQRVALELRGTLDRTWRYRLTGSYGHYLPFRRGGERADIYRASAQVSIPVRSWLYARAAYTFYHEAIPDPAFGRDVNRNRIALSLNAGAPLGAGHPIPGNPFGSWRPPLWSMQ